MDMEVVDVTQISERFRGYFPVVVDAETGGLNPRTDALLEVTAVTLAMDKQGQLAIANTYTEHIEPFEGANIEQASLEINHINPSHPFRVAVAKSEREALSSIFKQIKKEQQLAACSRCILVGHNAAFDQSFIDAAAARCNLKRSPFHPFSNFDTVSLGGLAYGQTVLARCCAAAGIDFDANKAHSSRYDALATAKLFCKIINNWQDAIGGSFYIS
jgi:ribonuclease T